MSAKHTPGEWYVHPTEEPTAIMAGDYYVATAHAIGWTGDHAANAALISAAPEMLEALRYIVGWKATGWDPEKARDMARLAIRKATGAEGGGL